MSNLPDTVAPTLVSASVRGTLLTLTYSEPLDDSVDIATSAFSLTVNGLIRPVTGVEVHGAAITLTLASAVERYQVVELNYDPPVAGPVMQDPASNPATAISGQSVLNASVGSPVFNLVGTNPYGLVDVGAAGRPGLADLDGDGDLDLLYGHSTNGIKYYQNIGTATSPAFGAGVTNPFGFANANYAAPTFADINGDGLIDVVLGDHAGRITVYLNTGSATQPAFTSAGINPYGLASVGSYARPALADLDGDGDLDMMIGNNDGNTLYYRNDGTATAPSYTLVGTNPFGLQDVGAVSTPVMLDLDNDGDLDLLIGTFSGDTLVYLNEGTSTAPSFTLAGTNLYGLVKVDTAAAPTLADLNGDGYLDLLYGSFSGNSVVYLQGPPPPGAPVGLALSLASNSGATDDNLTNATVLVVTGQAVPLSSVRLFAADSEIGSTTANADGTWEIAATPLPEGTYALTAKAASPYHTGESVASLPLNVEIDTTAPGAPVVSSAALTEDAAPTISGTAEAGSRITVEVGGATYVTVATDGSWSVDLALPPASGTLQLNTRGENAVNVIATDLAGNPSQAGTQTLVIQAGPDTPVVTSAALTNQITPTISGTADAGAIVTVSVGGATFTTVATDGQWSVDLSTSPATGVLVLNVNGSNAVTVTAEDSGGHVSAPGAHSLVIDSTAPGKPLVDSAALVNTTTPTIHGMAETGSTVTVSVAGATYTTVASGGQWSVDLSTAPTSGTLTLNANGNNTVSVTAQDAAGNVSEAGTQTLVIDTTAPVQPIVTSAALVNTTTPTISGTAEAGSTVTVSVGGATFTTVATDGHWSVDLSTTPATGVLALDANGDNPVSVMTQDAAGNASEAGTQTLVVDTTAPAQPIVTSAALVNTTTPTISGTAEAGSTVMVAIGGAVYTTVAAGGHWSVDLSAAPTTGTLQLDANGSNAVSVTAQDAAGNTSEAGTQMLAIDTTAPAEPVVTSAALVNTPTPTVSGTAEAGSMVTVSIGGATYTTVATGGHWSVDLSTAPATGVLALDANGDNPVSVTAQDAAGNVSEAGTQTLVIDTTAPAEPVVTSAALVNTTTPTISGTAEAGSMVTVSIGGATYTTVATGGHWSVDLSTAPATGVLALDANGDNPVSVTAQDAAGNVSETGTQTLVIDTTAPAEPVVTSATLVNTTTPTISGTAETGSSVTVSVGGATYVTMATSGHWSVDLSLAPSTGELQLDANGDNAVIVTAYDAAGNASEAGTQTLVIDTTAPAEPVVTSAALVNTTTPTISGTAEAGSTVTVSVGGATFTTVATDGHWSVDLSTTPATGALALDANGDNPVSVTAQDAAGNASEAGTQTLVIDTTAPAQPIVTSAVLVNTTTPTISGTAEAGSTVTVSVGGATYTAVAAGGHWSVDLSVAPTTGTLQLDANGHNPVSVTAQDAAGNASEAGTQMLVIDTTAPAQPIVTSATLVNTTTPTISGTAEAGSTVTVAIGGAVYTTVATDGQWSVDLSAAPTTGTLQLDANGDNPVSVTAQDAAGNASEAGTQTLVIDTTAPINPVVTSAALVNTPTPTISGTAEAGSAVTVAIGGAVYTTVATDGHWSVDLSAAPTTGTLQLDANGDNPVSVTAQDAAGNTSEAGTQTLVIDTTAPAEPVVTSAALVNTTTPTISGTAEAGSTVMVSVGGATYITVATGGHWSVDLFTAPATGVLALNANGSNAVSVTAQDAAGNVSEAGTQTLVIDTTAPVQPIVTSAALVNTTTPTISGTAEAGSTVTVSVGGATFTTVATDGHWSVDLSTTPATGVLALDANGDNPVSVTAQDAAGNASEAGTQTLVIDTTAPAEPVVTSAALVNTTTPTISGMAEAGSTVAVSVGGATYTTVAFGGHWSVDLSLAPSTGELQLDANGDNAVIVTAYDAAGNVSDAGTQTLVIDTTAPAEPVVTSAALVNTTTPTISGTAEAGSTVTVSVGGATYTAVAAGGHWSVHLPAAPITGALQLNANGDNPVSVTAQDAAGNVSEAGMQTLVIDTTAPAEPVVTSAALVNTTTPTISGTAEAGSTIAVSVGGAMYVALAASGHWSVDLSAAPTTGVLQLDANGGNPVSVTAQDAAGNVSEAGTQTLVIDTTAPMEPVVTSAALVNATTPTISGTAEAGSAIVVSVGGATYVTSATDGHWSVDLSGTPTTGTLQLDANGNNPVSVTAQDAAGNVSEAGTQTLVIDTTAPTEPVVTSAALANTTTPTISGTAEAGSVVTVSIGGATFTTVATDGHWSVDLSTTPATGALALDANGDNLVSVTAQDAAGNASEAGTQTLVIDTTAPAGPIVTSAAFMGTTTPTISGTAEAGTTIIVSIGGATYTTVVTDGVWTVNLTDAPATGTLQLNANGENAVSVTAQDAAGNVSEAGTQTLVIDTTAPLSPVVTSRALVNTTTPTLSGTAEVGSLVSVSVGGAIYTTVAVDGVWRVDLAMSATTGALQLNANGSNLVSVIATDAVGNVSEAGTQTLIVDTTLPATPWLSATAGVNVWTIEVSGLEPGATWQYRLSDGLWTAGQGNSFTVPFQAFAAEAIEVRQFDAAGNLSTVGRNAQALVPFRDADGDGMDDGIEQGVPGMDGGAQGDGNGDGIPDIEQADVTSLIWRQSLDGQTRYVTLTNSAGLAQEAVSTSVLAIDTLPAALTLPLGALAFTVRDVPENGIVNFSIFLDADIPVNGYWKEIDGQWINLATAVTQVGGKTRIDFSIEDGGAFDADGVRNGVIVDPGAPGWFEGDPFDTDGDQVPDRLEPDLGLTVGVKDNDVFARDDLFVMQVYRDALGREAEASGMDYWQGLLASGARDHASVVLQVLSTAEAEVVDVLARLAFGLTGEAPLVEDLAAWRASLAADATLDTLVAAAVTKAYGDLTDSAFVDLLYQDALDRSADAGGHTYWLAQLAQGQRRVDVVEEVLRSAEFSAAHGDDVALVGVYTALLGRAIDEQGLAYWRAELADDRSIEDVVVAILGSAEYHDRLWSVDGV